MNAASPAGRPHCTMCPDPPSPLLLLLLPSCPGTRALGGSYLSEMILKPSSCHYPPTPTPSPRLGYTGSRALDVCPAQEPCCTHSSPEVVAAMSLARPEYATHNVSQSLPQQLHLQLRAEQIRFNQATTTLLPISFLMAPSKSGLPAGGSLQSERG